MQKYIKIILETIIIIYFSLSFFSKLMNIKIFHQFLYELTIVNPIIQNLISNSIFIIELLIIVNLFKEKKSLLIYTILNIFLFCSILLHSTILYNDFHFTCGCFSNIPYFTSSKEILISLIPIIVSSLFLTYKEIKNMVT